MSEVLITWKCNKCKQVFLKQPSLHTELLPNGKPRVCDGKLVTAVWTLCAPICQCGHQRILHSESEGICMEAELFGKVAKACPCKKYKPRREDK